MKRWYQEKKKEHFYKEAKKQGYRARSAFKLKQIQDKYKIFANKDIVLDLGSAPGGWSQVAKEYVGKDGTVISTDILPMTPIKDVKFIQGDITDDITTKKINEILKNNKVNVVLSDMSPDISGNYSVDQARSLWLCETALTIAEQLLSPHGIFICKIFEGEDTKKFLEKLKHRFNKVKSFSPTASRKSSSEIYIIAKTLKNTPK